MKNYNLPTFLKWAGGKSQLLSQFEPYFPSEIETYYEPFLGGGAVFFFLKAKYKLKKAILSDNNDELINCFKEVKKNPNELIELLENHKNKHSRDYYYCVRDDLEVENLSDIERAARLIYLNKTCYNGLYRVNSKGKFNVPLGSYKNPQIFNKETIFQASKLLKGTKLKCMSFEKIASFAERRDFIYFDPPYFPISKTAYFTSYTKDLFLEAEQEQLANLYERLDKKGCLLMLSNSDCEFIRNLYKKYRIETVEAKRAISCNANTRGKISELLVLNF